MPDDILKEFIAPHVKHAKAMGDPIPSLKKIRVALKDKRISEERMTRERILPSADFQEKHGKSEYFTAFKFWLMAPPNKKSDFMDEYIRVALLNIGDDSVMPLLIEAIKNDVNKWKFDKVAPRFIRRSVIIKIGLIASMPGEEALDALLECNRYAINNKLNGDDYFESITRHIIRRLASRKAHADRFIDPSMKEINEKQGRTEKPEDIALQDDLWKQYKPLLEARLRDKKDTMPKEDFELIEAALAIMPKGKQLEPKE